MEAQDQIEHECTDWIKPKQHLTQKQTQKQQDNQGFMKNKTKLNEHKNKTEGTYLLKTMALIPNDGEVPS